MTDLCPRRWMFEIAGYSYEPLSLHAIGDISVYNKLWSSGMSASPIVDQ
jgi:hypothetical protein